MAVGIPPWRLWALTPSEISLAIQGALSAQQSQRDLALTAAWTTAALMRKRGRLPTLRSLLRGGGRRRLKRLTKAEREARIAAINAQFPPDPPPAETVPELTATTNGQAHGG